jgi:hypothetical protein
MSSDTRNCQSCKKDFAVEPDELTFYEQMEVPVPSWCPECRRLRRMAWYGYRILYKRKCDLTGDSIITIYHPDLPCKVYRQDVWWGDGWDPREYGREYDIARPFFEQYKELMDAVPKAALHTEYTTMIDSPYCDAASYIKNGYLCFKHITGEDCGYTNVALRVKNSFDLAYSSDPELCYEVVNIHKCYQAFFSQDLEDCRNIYFSRDLTGCNDCVGCVNLRNQSYCIFNEKLSKDEYQRRFREFDFGTVGNVEDFKKRSHEFSLKYPRRAFDGRNNNNVSGNYAYNCKNSHDIYFVSDSENVRHSELFIKGNVQNSQDFTAFGSSSEWVYEATWTGLNAHNVKFSVWNYRGHDTEYTFACHGAEYLFGCVGFKKGEYCILNKQYGKQEYFDMVERIKKQMVEMPFVDRRGMEHRYGSQIPIDLCPWAYNESTAYEFFPLEKADATARGFTWREADPREYRDATIFVPQHIKSAGDEILSAILKCDACGKNYQIISMELQFLRRFNFPIPRQCPLCRDRERIKKLNPMAAYERTCDKCAKTIHTAYASDRPEIVYCEECYLADVV